MISPKLLLSLMVAGSWAAPQINERQVVGDVLAQLQPAITRALSGLGSQGGSSSFGRGGGSSSFGRGGGSSFSAPAQSFSSAPVIQRFTPARAQAPRGGPSFSGGFSSGGGTSVSSVTSSVVSQLQPSIAAAVAQALRASQGANRGSLGGSGGQEEYADGPASYQYEYKVSDDEAQAYIAHQEAREGDDVTGSYNYVDPTGSLVTVNYQAGPEGYSETRDVQKGAVEMRNIPGAWTGPLAGVDDIPGAQPARQSGGVSQSELIARILAQIQPQITGAVQSAIGGNRGSSGFSQRVSPGFGQATIVRAPAPAPVRARSGGFGFSGGRSSGGNSGLVSNIIASLQPRISSAVNSAISGSRGSQRGGSRGSFSRGQQVSGGGNSLVGLFGTPGQTSVSLQTPEFNVQY